MFFQKINRSDPEKVFIVVKNSYSTAAITVGQIVCFDYTTDADGVGVTLPSTALLPHVAGVVSTSSIAAGDYGLLQVYGHNADCLVLGTTDVAAGDQLIATNAQFYAAKAAATDLHDACVAFLVAGEAYTTNVAAAKKVFIRAL